MKAENLKAEDLNKDGAIIYLQNFTETIMVERVHNHTWIAGCLGYDQTFQYTTDQVLSLIKKREAEGYKTEVVYRRHFPKN